MNPSASLEAEKPLLYIVPHAGGAAYQYARFKRWLEPTWEVRCCELPGRGQRIGQAFVANFSEAVDDGARQVAPEAGRPWLMLGHSLGAHLSVALLQRRHGMGLSLPGLFVPSGSVAPPAYCVTPVSHLASADFWQTVQGFGGTPDLVIEDAEYRNFFENIVRRDMALLESVPNRGPQPLPVPILACHGTQESAAANMDSWQSESHHPVRVQSFPGGHFYIFEHAQALAMRLRQAWQQLGFQDGVA